MKQLDLTPELVNIIKASVGDDVDPSGFAVFEAIAINSRPLPGKRNSIFEGAIVTPLTIKQMADNINNGNHLPLVSDHDLTGTPKGRVFLAEPNFAADGSYELRTLFYLDSTETTTIAKLNAGSLDEVSVSFLSSQLLCSECGWDYFGADATGENIYTRTCLNDHTVGEDGVHVNLVGLSQFIELSLVPRGAADKAKIVGKSQSVLQPSGLRLAARGFEVDSLICRASLGEKVVTVDTNALITQLSEARGETISLGREKDGLNTQLSAATAARDTALGEVATLTAQVTDLTAQLATASAAPSNQADYDAAVTFLQDVLKNVLTASGAEVPAELPTSVANLTAAIKDKTSNLTAILPVGGVAAAAGSDAGKAPALVASAFTNRILK